MRIVLADFLDELTELRIIKRKSINYSSVNFSVKLRQLKILTEAFSTVSSWSKKLTGAGSLIIRVLNFSPSSPSK